MEESFEASFDTPFCHSPTTATVDGLYLVLVPPTEVVEFLELLNGHAGVVAPTISTHVSSLHLLDVVEGVAMEVGYGCGNDFVDKGFVSLEETFLPTL